MDDAELTRETITGDRAESKQVIKQMSQRIQVAVSAIKKTKQGQPTELYPVREETATHHTQRGARRDF